MLVGLYDPACGTRVALSHVAKATLVTWDFCSFTWIPPWKKVLSATLLGLEVGILRDVFAPKALSGQRSYKMLFKRLEIRERLTSQLLCIDDEES